MSNFTKNENDNWQKEVRGKLEDLQATLSISNIYLFWNPWEVEFIENVCEKLEQEVINVSPKQYDKICDLWERI